MAKHLADGLGDLPSMAKALSNTHTEGGLEVGEQPKPGVVAQYSSLSTGEAEARRLVVWGQPELNSVKRGGG